MSASAMPSVLSPAMIDVIVVAAPSRAALTVGLVSVTPRFRRATSGTTVILPVADTVMVRAGADGSVGAPATGPGRTDSAATATTSAPSAAAPRVRRVWDIGAPVMLAARSRVAPAARRRDRGAGSRRSDLPARLQAEGQRRG